MDSTVNEGLHRAHDEAGNRTTAIGASGPEDIVGSDSLRIRSERLGGDRTDITDSDDRELQRLAPTVGFSARRHER